MTFDQLCKRLLEAAPGITAPVVPKTGLSAPGGRQLINAPQTSVKPQYTGTEAPTDATQDAQQQPNTPEQQTKQIQDLQTMVASLTTTLADLQKAQGMPPGPKKPSFTSAPVAPQPQVK